MYASYIPSTNSWGTPPNGPFAGRYGPVGVWTGREFIVAGGTSHSTRHNVWKDVIDRDAAAYNPATKTWRMLPPMPVARDGGSAIWDGHEMIVVGGGVSRGVAFDPATNTWRWLAPMRYPRTGQVAVWTGNQVLVWGGEMGTWQHPVAPPHGEAYDPTTDQWTAMTRSPLQARTGALAVWTGSQMIVWGGTLLNGPPVYNAAAFTPGTT
jgi:N-acetylneuraminic acid mutarotase